MSRWLLRRSLEAAAAFIVAVLLMFVLMRVAPGDPLSRVQDRAMSPRELATLRAQYGLDQPVARQLAAFVRGVARGDLGISIQYGRPVTQLLRERLPATLLLGGTAMLLNFTVGLWLGVWQAVRRGTVIDRSLTVVTLAAFAMPSFWLGLVLAWAVGVHWHLLPAAGMSDPLLESSGLLARSGDVLRHLVLPALTLTLVTIAGTIRYQRNAMLEVLRFPYIVTARAKGLAERQVTWRHAWRNAVTPLVTIFGLWLPVLVTGSVFVEAVFAWPGLGSLAAAAVGNRDYPLIMGAALLASALVVIGSLVTDLAYAVLDPRIRLA